jgi:hypothetical protein
MHNSSNNSRSTWDTSSLLLSLPARMNQNAQGAFDVVEPAYERN